MDIPGATGASYLITGDEPSNFLRVRVGFTDGLGYGETVTSDAAVWPQLGELWTAALTVGWNAPLDRYGFGENYEGGALSDADFSHAGKDHTFKAVSVDPDGILQLLLEPELAGVDADLLDFYLWAHPFRFSGRSSSESSLNLNDSGRALIVWTGTGQVWSRGEVIRLALKAANQSAGGAPVIRGAPRVDDVLTVDTSGITDANGVPGDAVFSYQWFNGATNQDVPGATGASFPLESSHFGLTFRVRVGFTDAHNYQETVTSGVTAPVAERAHKFWTATLTATRSSGPALVPIFGYPDPLFPGSSLTGATVTYGPNTYTVDSVQMTGSAATYLSVRFSPAPTQEEVETWILDVNGREYFPSESMTPPGSEPERTFLWASSGMSWSDGEVVSLALKVLNRPAQGRPGISGTRKSGATLTADSSGITDPDGVPEDALTYQWFSVDLGGAETDIPGATGPSYIIPGDLEDDFLGVRVGFTDSHGFDESVASEELLWRRGGEIWAALMTVGQVSGSQTNFGYHTTYEGASLWPREFRFNSTDYEVTRTSLFPLFVPGLGGDSRVAIRLDFDFAGQMTGDTADLLTLKVGEALTGTTSFRFVDRAASSTLDPNRVEVRIEWLDTGLSWSKGDKIRVALSAANQDHSGTVALLGQPKVGRLLWADPSGLADPDGVPGDVVFTYQWVRCLDLDGLPSDDCGDIPGADGPSYRLSEADENRHVGVRVSFHDNLGYLEEQSSAVAGPVEAGSQAADFWTATVTVKEGAPGTEGIGYDIDGSKFPGSGITEGNVTFRASPYVVRSVLLTESGNLEFTLAPPPPDEEFELWILDTPLRELHLADADLAVQLIGGRPTSADFLWDDQAGQAWSDGDMVQLSLKLLNRPAQGRPGISGTPRSGATLTADSSGITDPDGVPEGALTYQWFSVDLGGAETDIPGATGPSYIIPGDLEDDFLGVRVGFTDSHGFDESVASEEVAMAERGRNLGGPDDGGASFRFPDQFWIPYYLRRRFSMASGVQIQQHRLRSHENLSIPSICPWTWGRLPGSNQTRF